MLWWIVFSCSWHFLCARSDCADPCALAKYCSLISSFSIIITTDRGQFFDNNVILSYILCWESCWNESIIKDIQDITVSSFWLCYSTVHEMSSRYAASQSKNYRWAASAKLRRCVVGLLRLNPVTSNLLPYPGAVPVSSFTVFWVIIWSDTHLCYALQHLCCADIRQLFRNRALRSSGCCVRHQIWPMKHAEPSVRILKPGVILCCTRNVDWHYWLDWIPKRKCLTFIHPSSF